MDGMLSQDEINALLAGMDTSGGGDAAPADAPSDSGMEAPEAAAASAPSGGSGIDESLLTDTEKDAIGEVANISMGSSATTLYSLVNQKVNITTPQVELANWENVINNYERPCVFIQIKYTVGLDGTNILILKEHDVMVITDLMMGGDGTNTDGEIGELQLSAISEAMNQMMGAAATVLNKALTEGRKMIESGEKDASKVKNVITGIIEAEPLSKIDYVEIVDWKTLEPTESTEKSILCAVAVYIGKTRLIDNFIIEK